MVRIHPDPPQTSGAVAQLGEHLLCKQGVVGSIPISSTRVSSRGISNEVFTSLVLLRECIDRLLFNNSGFEGGVLAWWMVRVGSACWGFPRVPIYRGARTRLGDVLHRLLSDQRTAQAQEFLWRCDGCGGLCSVLASLRGSKVIGSSEQVHVVDALAMIGDEGRHSLRKAAGSRQIGFDPRISEWGNPAREGHPDRKSTRLNSSHIQKSRMPSSA